MKNKVAMLDFSKIDYFINRKYLSWAELGRKSGLSSATIFALKAGRRNASYKTIRKIATALGVEPSEIVKEEQL